MEIEGIRALAEVERQMDDGTQPFVIAGETRMAVQPSVMAEMGLACGQTVSMFLATEIMRYQLAHCQTQMALIKAAEKLDQ